MGHAVHYRTSTGEARLDEVGSLEEALAMVDHLRNDEGVSDVRVYQEVPITFRTYYKATVAGETAPAATPADAAPAVPAGAEASAPEDAETAPAASVDAPPGAMPLAPPVPPARTEAPAEVDGLSVTTHDEVEAGRKGLFSRS
ncbi:MAG: hypothetical protein ACLGIR_09705 [Actinomycetes bacterium]